MNIPWPGFNDMDSLIIPLAWNDVPFAQSAVYIGGERFEPKDELHVTVIGKKAGRDVQTRLSRAPRTEAALQQDFESLDWSFTPGTKVHVLSRATRKSRKSTIVLPLQMPGMNIFYESLQARDLVAGDTPLPPPHITLYHRNCPKLW
ncbi:MAG: hypothetical protein GY815_12850 [Gammaproteobacteria bacterium]|nr:hypothetical protein [Gammaproteobacteria bacterium]